MRRVVKQLVEKIVEKRAKVPTESSCVVRFSNSTPLKGFPASFLMLSIE